MEVSFSRILLFFSWIYWEFNFVIEDIKIFSKNTQNKIFSSLLDLWLRSIPKWSPLNVLPPVILLLLTLRTRSSVWNLKKMPVISLYWFAAEQQSSTCRRQKSHSIYSIFSVEENELTPSFQNPQKVAKKLQKPNNARKT